MCNKIECIKPLQELFSSFKNVIFDLFKVDFESDVFVYCVTAFLRFEDMERLKMLVEEFYPKYASNISMFYFYENTFHIYWREER